LRQWIREADIVVDSTASPTFSLLINDLCIREGQPAVYVTAHRRAAIGRVRIVRPGRDACLVCYEVDHASSQPYPRIPPGDEGEFTEAGCGDVTVEAAALDIDEIAGRAARVTLGLLQATTGANNHLLVVNGIVPGTVGDLARPGLHWSRWSSVPICEACGWRRVA